LQERDHCQERGDHRWIVDVVRTGVNAAFLSTAGHTLSNGRCECVPVRHDEIRLVR
jgi:hypothetical protein